MVREQNFKLLISFGITIRGDIRVNQDDYEQFIDSHTSGKQVGRFSTISPNPKSLLYKMLESCVLII
ncbi:MAG: hypothetical protein ACJA01_000532 [Saprospiraceae bacterium]|jgi:hypothetical protein